MWYNVATILTYWGVSQACMFSEASCILMFTSCFPSKILSASIFDHMTLFTIIITHINFFEKQFHKNSHSLITDSSYEFIDIEKYFYAEGIGR